MNQREFDLIMAEIDEAVDEIMQEFEQDWNSGREYRTEAMVNGENLYDETGRQLVGSGEEELQIPEQQSIAAGVE